MASTCRGHSTRLCVLILQRPQRAQQGSAPQWAVTRHVCMMHVCVMHVCMHVRMWQQAVWLGVRSLGGRGRVQRCGRGPPLAHSLVRPLLKQLRLRGSEGLVRVCAMYGYMRALVGLVRMGATCGWEMGRCGGAERRHGGAGGVRDHRISGVVSGRHGARGSGGGGWVGGGGEAEGGGRGGGGGGCGGMAASRAGWLS